MLHIAEVERETGLGKDTLRVWEKRYGFPKPHRDSNGERAYPLEQVQRLHTIKRLLSQGLRPRHVVGLTSKALSDLADQGAKNTHLGISSTKVCAIAQHWQHIKNHQASVLQQSLHRDLLRMGAFGFMTEIVAPLNHTVGEAWACGEIEVFEEHLYTETVTVVLRKAIAEASAHQTSKTPVVLLTTLPCEPHMIGMLMAQTTLALAGANCICLGLQTPIQDIVKAAQAHHVDIVGLSFSTLPPNKAVIDGINSLRTELPSPISLWVGGSHTVLPSVTREDITILQSLGQVEPAVQTWQANV